METSSFISVWWDSQGLLTLTYALIWAPLFYLARRVAPDEVRSLRTQGWLVLVYVTLGLAAALNFDPFAPKGFRVSRFAADLLGVAIGVGFFNALVLGIGLGRFQRTVPTVLRTVLSMLALVIAAVVLLAKQGLDVKALLPTGAVLTAVVGLALQQTLGNLIGGLSIQLDKSVRVGDWIQVEGLYGRVSAIRWRSTTLETNDFETVVVPNSQLLAAKLLVRGRRDGQDTPWRRWVRFKLPFSAPSAEVLQLALEALRHDPLPHVAIDPAPNCVLLSLEEGVAHYALRYWLTDFTRDDATDSAVRLRLLYALRRAGFEPALPAHQLTLVESSAEAREAEVKQRQEAREQALKDMELFAHLQPAELRRLAADLKDVPFAPGEALCRQGDAGDSLYILSRGRVSVRVSADGGERELAQLGTGSYFGEMALMTGEPRSATVLALDHVDAYRLEKPAFRHLLQLRPELAEAVAEVLAERRVGLEQAKDKLDQQTRAKRHQEHRGQLLARIREFFSHHG